MYIVALTVIGAVVGSLARLIGPPEAPGSPFGSALAGGLGALVGQTISRFGSFSDGHDLVAIVAALVGTSFFVVFYHAASLPRAAR